MNGSIIAIMRISQNKKLEKILELALARLAPIGLTMMAQGRVTPCATLEEAFELYGPLVDLILNRRVQQICSMVREVELGGVGISREEHLEILRKKYHKKDGRYLSRSQLMRYLQIFKKVGPFGFLHKKRRRI